MVGRLTPLARLAGLGALIVTLTAVTAFAFERLGDNAFIAQALSCGVLAMVATRVAEACPQRQALLVIVATALVLRVVLLATPPFLSNDILRYVWDGRVQAAGINPYRYVPVAPELQALREPVIFPHINRADYAVTVYPPAAQMLFLLVTRIGESVVVMKAALVAMEAVTFAAIVAMLRRLGRPPARVVAYAWHPLAAWEIAGSGHVDAAMLALALLALWLFASGRSLAAGVVATVGALVKPLALLLLPAFWRPWDWKLPLVVLGVAALLYLPYLSVGADVLGFLPQYVGEERLDTGSAFWLLGMLRLLPGAHGLPTGSYLAGACVVIVAVALRAGFRERRSLAVAIGDINLLLLVFLFLLSPDYPWYFLVLVPFLALTGSWTGWAMTIGAFALYDVRRWDFEVAFELRDTAFNVVCLAVAALAAWRIGRARIRAAWSTPGR